MTIAAPPEAPPAPVRPGPDTSVRRLWRAFRFPVILLTALSVVAVLLSLGTERFPTGLLEPGSPSPDGTRAFARILGERSDVTVVRDSGAAVDAVERAGEDTVLLIFLDHRLLPEELDTLSELGTDTVLVQPSLRSLTAFAPGTDVTGRGETSEPVAPDCPLPAAEAAGDARIGGTPRFDREASTELYSVADGVISQSCYPGRNGSALVRVDSPHGGATTVLGSGTFLTNDALDSDGNAALGLNLASAENVVWLRPDPPTQVGGATMWELLSSGLRWSLLPLVLTLALLALWRGRRMGALVPESLPVVVRASETTEGRARLYRSRRARDRAVAALRAGFLERAVPRLGLNSDSGPDAVISSLATRTGEDPDTLGPLLYPGPTDPYAANDEAMLRLADTLDGLARRLR